LAESDKTANPLRPRYDKTSKLNVVTVVVPTVLVTSFVLLLCGVAGVMMIASKFRSSKREVSAREDVASDSPSDTPVQLYESVFPMEFQEQGIDLKENTAYGPLPNMCHGTANEPVYSNVT
jgi:hypothetical protein